MACKKYGHGWYNESQRHSLARQGIKTGRKVNYAYVASDLPGIVTTGLGTAGATAVSWIPTLIALGVTKKVIKDIKEMSKKSKKTNYSKREIRLIDASHYKFGSVTWQKAMLHNVTEKLKSNEELSDYEKTFLVTQREHAKKINLAKKVKKEKLILSVEQPTLDTTPSGKEYRTPGYYVHLTKKGDKFVVEWGDERTGLGEYEFDDFSDASTEFNRKRDMYDIKSKVEKHSKVNYQQTTYSPTTVRGWTPKTEEQKQERKKLEPEVDLGEGEIQPGWIQRGIKKEARFVGGVARGVGKVTKGIFGTVMTGLAWDPETEKIYYSRLSKG